MLNDQDPAAGLIPGSAHKRDQKFWIAMGLFAILAVVIWFSFGDGTIFVSGRPIQLRLVPLLIVGLFAFRTVMAREADKIRRRDAEGQKL
jgi:hypothetical protein